MAIFNRAAVSIPGHDRQARTPFGTSIVIHATGAETGGAFGMWDTFTPPGMGPAPHMHTRETEVFRVIKGTYRVRCGEEEFVAPAGSVIVLPPHIQHSWTNISDEPGQMFGIVTPAGAEMMFIDIATENPATEAEVAIIETRYGIINEATKALGNRT